MTNRQCPRCGSTDIKGSDAVYINRKTGKPVRIVGYRCGRCDWFGPWEQLQKQKSVKSERHDMKKKGFIRR